MSIRIVHRAGCRMWQYWEIRFLRTRVRGAIPAERGPSFNSHGAATGIRATDNIIGSLPPFDHLGNNIKFSAKTRWPIGNQLFNQSGPLLKFVSFLSFFITPSIC